jgi:hypothetical protein
MTVKKNGGVVARICPGVVHKIKVHTHGPLSERSMQ